MKIDLKQPAIAPEGGVEHYPHVTVDIPAGQEDVLFKIPPKGTITFSYELRRISAEFGKIVGGTITLCLKTIEKVDGERPAPRSLSEYFDRLAEEAEEASESETE